MCLEILNPKLMYSYTVFWGTSSLDDGTVTPKHVATRIIRPEYFIGPFQPIAATPFLQISILICTLRDKEGPCYHGMARPQVMDRGTASDMEGSCEYIE